MLNRTPSIPTQLYYSYAQEDEAICNRLEKQLLPLQRQGFLSTWQKHQIPPGSLVTQKVNEYFTNATIILLLFSPDFLASNSCCIEMQQAIERHTRGEACVIPVPLRPCNWQSACAPFSSLQSLPRNGRPISCWANPDEAFLQVEQGLRALIEHSSVLHSSSRKRGSPAQNRENILLRLQAMYEELLADSLQKVAWIDLDLKHQPEEVQSPAGTILARPPQTAHLLPPGESILQVYQKSNQELLLLGEPGAGKSTLLYRLGQNLLKDAIQHARHPLPVLFSLSSWAKKRLPLQEWMVEQLASQVYEVPREQSEQWFRDEQILPLLDGLDEIDGTAQPACIVAINAYRRGRSLCPLVVCSRCSDYHIASRQEKLLLQKAIKIQPLSPAQLEATLDQANGLFAALRAELKENQQLQDLAKTPLFLSLLLQIPIYTPVVSLPQQSSSLQKHIFQLYVQQMVEQKGERKGDRKRYPLPQTTRWLSWLAKQMRQQGQTVFSVEQLQPRWLPKQQRFKYRWSVMLLVGLFIGLLGWLPAGLLSDQLFGLLGGQLIRLLFGLTFGLTFGPLVGLLFGPLGELFHWQFFEPLVRKELQIILAERIIWSWKKTRNKLLVGLFSGMIIGPLGGLLFALFDNPLFALLGKPLSALLGEPLSKLPYEMLFRQPGGLLGGPLYGLLYGLVGGLLYGLIGGMTLSPLERHAFSPGEGIRRSLRNGLLIGLLYGLIGGLIGGPLFALLVGLPYRPFDELLSGLLGGLLYGLIGGLIGGLLAIAQHITLRFWLQRTGCLPFQVGTFLEDARARHLLGRVGGSYHFAHSLLDYFANLDEAATSASVPGLSTTPKSNSTDE